MKSPILHQISKLLFAFIFPAILLGSCMPAKAITAIPASNIASHAAPTSTRLPISTPTLIPTITSTPTVSSCQLSIYGTYNFSNTNKTFNLQPGKFLFYDRKGGGQYSNDQAGCELNADCTQLRAINKDSADPHPEGVVGSWVEAQTGKSTARWQSFVVECSLAP